jgi:hypothetical protein
VGAPLRRPLRRAVSVRAAATRDVPP